MTKSGNHPSYPHKIALIGNHLPRQCGIATFTTDLLAGLAEDLDIQATANSVSISGERHIPQEEENVSYYRREREGGRFSRAMVLYPERSTRTGLTLNWNTAC
jgi:hypothetical protein